MSMFAPQEPEMQDGCKQIRVQSFLHVNVAVRKYGLYDISTTNRFGRCVKSHKKIPMNF
jgi:hypothetical protein